MTTPAAIASVGTAKSGHLISQKMLAAGTSMAASAKNPYLVDKIAFLHKKFLTDKSKRLEVGDMNNIYVYWLRHFNLESANFAHLHSLI